MPDRISNHVQAHYTPQQIIIGIRDIAKYFHCHPTTINRWSKKHGLPVSYLPDGQRIITTTLIDAWLLARIEAHKQKKAAETLKISELAA